MKNNIVLHAISKESKSNDQIFMNNEQAPLAINSVIPAGQVLPLSPKTYFEIK